MSRPEIFYINRTCCIHAAGKPFIQKIINGKSSASWLKKVPSVKSTWVRSSQIMHAGFGFFFSSNSHLFGDGVFFFFCIAGGIDHELTESEGGRQLCPPDG